MNKMAKKDAGLKKAITVSEEVLHKIIHPVVELRAKDIIQMIVGASILAIPVGFTEEAWRLGETLPLKNILGFMMLSLTFISVFVYYTYHRHHGLAKHWEEFVKRIVSTYFFSFIVVTVLLMLIQKAPWGAEWVLAFKRTTLVSFPASMSAAVADMIR
jgi:uncharacterized membrane protein